LFSGNVSDAVEIGIGKITGAEMDGVDSAVGKEMNVGKTGGASTTGVAVAISVADGISPTNSVGILPQATKTTTKIIKKYRQGANPTAWPSVRRCVSVFIFLCSFSMVNNAFFIVTSLRKKLPNGVRSRRPGRKRLGNGKLPKLRKRPENAHAVPTGGSPSRLLHYTCPGAVPGLSRWSCGTLCWAAFIAQDSNPEKGYAANSAR